MSLLQRLSFPQFESYDEYSVEIYERWFGPKGELPYPMSPQVRSFMLLQVVPK